MSLLSAIREAASRFMPERWASEYANAVVGAYEAALYAEQHCGGPRAPKIAQQCERRFDDRCVVRGACDWTFADLDRDAVLDAVTKAAEGELEADEEPGDEEDTEEPDNEADMLEPFGDYDEPEPCDGYQEPW